MDIFSESKINKFATFLQKKKNVDFTFEKLSELCKFNDMDFYIHYRYIKTNILHLQCTRADHKYIIQSRRIGNGYYIGRYGPLENP